MINIKKLRFKNFLSYGNQPTCVEFDKSHITLIYSENNGAGKSAIYAALYFAIYGRAFSKGVNKDCLVNTINAKNCLVELWLEKDGTELFIARGIKPNVFDIVINGMPKKLSENVKNEQKWLESFLGMDSRTFRQIVMMGSTSYLPFMKLSAPERRVVIENILSIDIFSIMNGIAKSNEDGISNQLSAAKSELVDVTHRHELAVRTKETQRASLMDSIERNNQRIKSVKLDMGKILDDAQSLAKFVSSYDIDSLVKEVDTWKESESACKSSIVESKTRLKMTKQQLDFFKANTVCPKCSQPISNELMHEKTTEFGHVIDQCNKEMDSHKKKLDECGEILKKCLSDISDFKKAKASYDADIAKLNSLKREHDSYLADNERLSKLILEVTENSTECFELKSKMQLVSDEVAVLEKKLSAYGKIRNLLTDSGIKSLIIREYLPVLNSLIGKYLEKLSFNLSFKFDENFAETIKSRGRDILAYQSFSEGERRRIDLAILFAFRDLVRLRASVQVNTLFIDEFDGVLDSDGQTIVNSLLLDTNANVVIISQYPSQYLDIADRTIMVSKPRFFSETNESIMLK